MMNEKAKRRGQQLAAPYGKNMGASHGVQPLEASGNAVYVCIYIYIVKYICNVCVCVCVYTVYDIYVCMHVYVCVYT